MVKKKSSCKGNCRPKEGKVIAKKEVNSVKPENYFILSSGGVLKDITELALALDQMNDDDFKHHVNDMRNDFSNWIKDIFQELELADELVKTKDKKDTQIIILKHIVRKR